MLRAASGLSPRSGAAPCGIQAGEVDVHRHVLWSRASRWPGVLIAALSLVLAVAGLMARWSPTGQATAAAAVAADPVITAAGDIAPTGIRHQQQTSDRVLAIDPTLALTLGDEQYPAGGLTDFRAFYNPTWGRFKAKTKPAPGNHEYLTAGAAGYFAYFGAAARPHGTSYYSFDVGGWHLIALDSNIARGAGSAQERWLRADLAATSRRCVLAFWHHPRFSSGTHHGNNPTVASFWTDLYAAQADLVLNGHEHNYERFARQTSSGRASSHGIREFVVGTGGNGHYGFGTSRRNSQVRNSTSFGVLKLTLHPSSYSWQFVSETAQVLDSGGPVTCH